MTHADKWANASHQLRQQRDWFDANNMNELAIALGQAIDYADTQVQKLQDRHNTAAAAMFKKISA